MYEDSCSSNQPSAAPVSDPEARARAAAAVGVACSTIKLFVVLCNMHCWELQALAMQHTHGLGLVITVT
jgi:hypothetical protein